MGVLLGEGEVKACLKSGKSTMDHFELVEEGKGEEWTR